MWMCLGWLGYTCGCNGFESPHGSRIEYMLESLVSPLVDCVLRPLMLWLVRVLYSLMLDNI